jgi:hypothetical protein
VVGLRTLLTYSTAGRLRPRRKTRGVAEGYCLVGQHAIPQTRLVQEIR